LAAGGNLVGGIAFVNTTLAVMMPARFSYSFTQTVAFTLWTPDAGLPAFDGSVQW
jgi:hypothetical protein